jgi:kumamolisin
LSSQIILKGSQREHPKNSFFMGKPHAEERASITCILRRKIAAPECVTVQLSHEDFALAHGCDSADVTAVERFAAGHHLSVERVSVAARAMRLCGDLHRLSEAFGASLELRRIGDTTYRTRSGHLMIPVELDGIVVSILGLDTRPVARARHQVLMRAGQSSYTPNQVAQAYNFPAGQGAQQTVALIELGGGYNESDLTTYWKQVGVSNVSVTAVSVDGVTNTPSGDPNSADGEVALDIEVVGAIAPAAQIAVYFAGNTDQGFLDGINAAIHDTVRKPSVISISWGGAESNWTPQALNAFNAAFHDAALLGISVCVAAGDDGSNDGVGDGGNHVDFPASSPWVLACGGTRLQAHGSKIMSETVWNDGSDGGATGGGFSSHFSKPLYFQEKLATTGRGVPDVAGNADPETGYLIVVDGQSEVIGGTSAVAPLWAALLALCNENMGRNAGWIHQHLYGPATDQGAIRDITQGNNGSFKAAKGWDACTGLGTPNGQALLGVLKEVFSK